jgi:hypothetical protein
MQPHLTSSDDLQRRLPDGFWTHKPIRIIPALADLREQVLLRSTKRMPKWKFRIDGNLIVQIQPKVTDYFECLVVGYVAPTIDDFTGKPCGEGWIRIRFWIEMRDDDWGLKPKGIDRSRDVSGRQAADLIEKLIAKLDRGIFDKITAAHMLAPKCLLCGKQLTDPVSMARFIGPECAGTSSNKVPTTFRLDSSPTSEPEETEQDKASAEALKQCLDAPAPAVLTEPATEAEEAGQIVFDTVLDALIKGDQAAGPDETLNALAQAITFRFDEDDLRALVAHIMEEIETPDERFLRTMDPTKVGKITFLPEMRK